MKLKQAITALLTLALVLGCVPGVSLSPAAAAGSSAVAQFVADEHVLMLRADGRLLGWGDNRYGQLGLGSSASSSYSDPVEITFFRGKSPIRQIAALEQASVVLLENGELYACGNGANGRNGLLNSGNTNTWTLVPNSKSMSLTTLHPGKKCFFATNDAKTLFACGANSSGQLGLGTTTDRVGLAQVKANVDLQDILITDKACAVIEYNGTFWYSGDLSANPLGLCWTQIISARVSDRSVVNSSGTKINVYQNFITAVCNHGTTTLKKPATKNILTNFTATASSHYFLPTPAQQTNTCHTHAVYLYMSESTGANRWYASVGKDYICTICTGSPTAFNTNGNETITHTFDYTSQRGTDAFLFNGAVATQNVAEVEVGNSHGFVLKDGKYYGFGGTQYKQLGTVTDGGSTQEIAALTSRVNLLKSQGYTSVDLIVNGDSNFLLAKNNYQSVVYFWGFNRYGMGGIGNETLSIPTITEIASLGDKNITQIVCGRYNTYFIAKDGDIYAAGQGYSSSPTALSGIKYLPDILPPDPPTLNAPAKAEAGEDISLTWSPGSPGDTVGYELSRASGSRSEVLYSGTQTGHTFSADLAWSGATYSLVALNSIDDQSEAATAAIAVVDTKPPQITDVTFNEDNTQLTVTGSDTGSGVKGFYINNTFHAAARGSLSYAITDELEFSILAEDNAGNKSAGNSWPLPDEIPPTIDKVEFSEDNATATITASDTGGSGLKSVTVNGTVYETTGEAVEYSIPAKTRYLELLAEDRIGNRPPLHTERVPGWGEIVDTMTVEYQFSEDFTELTATAVTTSSQTTVAGIYVGDDFHDGHTVTVPVEQGAKYINLQAKNNLGDLSPLVRARVPGWTEITNSITISLVEFNDDSSMATITAASQNTAIAGIYVSDEYFELNPLQYHIPDGTQHLKIQAQDEYGDKSQLITKRVPGWSGISDKVTIQSVLFSQNNSVATITAAVSDGTIKGVRVNGVLVMGNPITYTVPTGTQTLQLQAEAEDGRLSAIVQYQVPTGGSSSGMVTIQSVTFSRNNTSVQITAAVPDGTIKGVRVNGILISGNPVTYRIPSGTRILELQAEAEDGRLSSLLQYQVPGRSNDDDDDNDRDSSNDFTSMGQTTASITIFPPTWTKAGSARVRVSASDRAGVAKILAATDYTGGWVNITADKYIEITDNTNVYVAVVNENDWRTEKSQYIDCFDRLPPTFTVSQKDDIVTIQASDDKSGVDIIYVDNRPHPANNGTLKYQVSEGMASITVQAQDVAGNLSQSFSYPLLGLEEVIPLPGPTAPLPEPEEAPTGLGALLLPSSDKEDQDAGSAASTSKSSSAGVLAALLVLGVLGAAGWYVYTRYFRVSNEGILDDLEDLEYTGEDFTDGDAEGDGYQYEVTIDEEPGDVSLYDEADSPDTSPIDGGAEGEKTA